MCCFSALFTIVLKCFVELCEVLICFPGELCSVCLVIVSQRFPNRVWALSCSSGIDDREVGSACNLTSVLHIVFCVRGGELKVVSGEERL